MPPRGLAEATYCRLRAMTGTWPADFLAHVERSYRGRIPPRFLALVAKLARELEREREELERLEASTRGLPPMITIVAHDGTVLDRWRPTRDEWEAACP